MFSSSQETRPFPATTVAMYPQGLDLKMSLLTMCGAYAVRLLLHSPSEDSFLRRKSPKKFLPDSNKLARRKARLDELAALPFCSAASSLIIE